MQFCESCGSLMRSEGDRMVCSSCGASTAKDDGLAEAYTTTERQRTDDVIEADPGQADEGKPTATDVRCDSCGHDEAWYTIKQTASADEPPTRFFKCKRCGKRWRGYS